MRNAEDSHVEVPFLIHQTAKILYFDHILCWGKGRSHTSLVGMQTGQPHGGEAAPSSKIPDERPCDPATLLLESPFQRWTSIQTHARTRPITNGLFVTAGNQQ